MFGFTNWQAPPRFLWIVESVQDTDPLRMGLRQKNPTAPVLVNPCTCYKPFLRDNRRSGIRRRTQ